MTESKIIKQPRSKSISLICDEDQIKEIVLPLLNFTAYCLSIDKTNELRQLNTMLSSILPAKNKLALLLANKLCIKINPANLNSICVEIISHAGYFKISVIHDCGTYVQGYKIKITGKVTLPLYSKVSYLVKHKNPNLYSEELARKTITLTKDL